MQSALDGIRVLDLTRVLAGPFCTMLLGDLGAKIIKIEIPGVGDDSRRYPPFIGEESAYFMNLNRNKKSIVLNLKADQGKKIFLELVDKSDVIIENYRPGTMEKLGIGFETIHKKNPGIIYSAISGFGHCGSKKNFPGYDIIGQAVGGIMSVTGWPDSPPTRTGTAIADILAGLFSCVGILSGLIARKGGTPGQKIDIALVDSVVSAMETVIQIYLVEQREPQRVGNRYEFIYPYDSFKAKDGWVVLGIGNDKLWQAFCKSIAREDLINDKTYKHNVDRVKHHNTVKKIVEEWTTQKGVKEIVDFLLARHIPCAPINKVGDIVRDEHITKDRNMILEIDHPLAGKMNVIGSPIKMSKTPPTVESPAPILGQHTAEILKNVLRYTEDEINRLKEANVIA